MRTIVKISLCIGLAAMTSCGSGDTGEGYSDTTGVNMEATSADSVTSAIGDGDTSQQRGTVPDNTSTSDSSGTPITR